MLGFAFLLLLPFCLAAAVPAAPQIASNGRPASVIVTGDSAYERFAATELQRYLEQLSGARLEVVPASGRAVWSQASSLLVVGGAASNALIRDAVARKQLNFDGLPEDGYLLRRIPIEGRPAVVLSGASEAATLYAVSDFLERLGYVFLLTKDIAPPRRAMLPLPDLDERVTPAYRRRGVHVDFCYPNQTTWSLEYWKQFLDRMARMRMNYLQVFWFPYAPFLTYEYRGERNYVGDASTKESGYLLWAVNFGSHLAKDMVIGREHFKNARLAPPELQNVETPDEAFARAQELLRQVIAYAKSRKIRTWLAIDPVSLPANLARHTRSRTGDLPFHTIMGGVYVCPDDAVADEINASRLESLVKTYPEAEGYFLWFPELYPVCEDQRSRDFYLRERPKYFEEEVRLWKPYTNYARVPERVVDSNSAAITLMRGMLAARDRMNPRPNVGIGAFGRSYVYPILDRLVARDVPFTDMVSSAVWAPMGVPLEQFGGMGERERTLISRSDDDASMLGMQFNVNLYYKDRLYAGAREHGVAGHAMQVNRARGQEHNEKFLADAAWKPQMTPTEFYADYARRIFGADAAPAMREAFRLLEANEEQMNWVGHLNFACCGPVSEVQAIKRYSDQPNPYDGPTFDAWPATVERSRTVALVLPPAVARLRAAENALQRARANVAPQGAAELDYLINRTESYAMHLEALVRIRQAYIEFDDAFAARKAGKTDEFLRRLDHSLEMVEQSNRMARAMATRYAAIIDDPSDLGVLYRINIFMVHGFDIAEKFIRNIVNFHHGKDYLEPVPLETIYPRFPRIQAGKVW